MFVMRIKKHVFVKNPKILEWSFRENQYDNLESTAEKKNKQLKWIAFT